jgi:Ca2+-binding RTX toxin-like protein
MNTNRLATILVTLAAGLLPAASARAAVDLGPAEQFRFPAGTGLPQIDSTLVAADFDGDGNVDLLGAGSDTAAFLAGDGEGGFDPARRDPLRTNGEYREIEAADLNGDGHLDLVVALGDFEQSVATFLGNGDGTFTRRSATDLSEEPESVAVGDVDGDGDVDAVSTGFGNVQVLRNDGTGNLTADPAIDAPGNCCDAIALGRLDGDADLDVAAADPFGSLIVLFGDGAGGFGDQVSFSAHMGPSALATGDFDEDARTDVAGANFYDALSVTTLLGGEGTTECRGETAQYIGLAPGETGASRGQPREDDVANGSSADDVISTGAGEDAPFGNKGDDVICGGAEEDFIRSHVGDDVLVGGPGPDRLNGGSGNDVCIGGGGADKLHNCEEER